MSLLWTSLRWPPRATLRWAGVLLAAFVLLLGGCGSRPVAKAPDQGADNLNRFGAAYVLYTEQHKRPPQSSGELKAQLPEIDQPGFLDSTRDGQPFVILWGADPRTGMGESPLVIAYEQQGKDGFRYVYTAMGMMPMDEEGFGQATFPEGKKPGSVINDQWSVAGGQWSVVSLLRIRHRASLPG